MTSLPTNNSLSPSLDLWGVRGNAWVDTFTACQSHAEVKWRWRVKNRLAWGWLMCEERRGKNEGQRSSKGWLGRNWICQSDREKDGWEFLRGYLSYLNTLFTFWSLTEIGDNRKHWRRRVPEQSEEPKSDEGKRAWQKEVKEERRKDKKNPQALKTEERRERQGGEKVIWWMEQKCENERETRSNEKRRGWEGCKE